MYGYLGVESSADLAAITHSERKCRQCILQHLSESAALIAEGQLCVDWIVTCRSQVHDNLKGLRYWRPVSWYVLAYCCRFYFVSTLSELWEWVVKNMCLSFDIYIFKYMLKILSHKTKTLPEFMLRGSSCQGRMNFWNN